MAARSKTGRALGQLFLSHAGLDEQAARAFCQSLRHHDIKVWFDKDDIRPGESWLPTIERAIQESSGMLVYVGKSGIEAWVDREVRLGLERNTKTPEAFHLIPVLGEGSDPSKLPAFLRQQQFVDLRDRRQAATQTLRLIEILKSPSSVTAVPTEYWTTNSPFRSLTKFEPQDSWLFFGRDSETETLLELVHRASVLAVLGTSGSGKSSLIRAGLIPALRRGRNLDGNRLGNSWRVAVFRPGSNPFSELAEALPDHLNPDLSPRDRTELIELYKKNLQFGGEALRNAIAGIVGSSRVLLVVDQFEEIFTLSDVRLRSDYIKMLFATARQSSTVPVHLILAIRADFYSNCLDHPELSSVLQRHVFNVPRIQSTVLREMIEQRLALAGADAESGLVDSLLADVGEEPGNLALLEHTLAQLWTHRQSSGTLTNRDYAAIGRLRGALGRHADDVIGHLLGMTQH